MIIQDYNNGMAIAPLMSKYNIGQNYVYKILNINKVKRRINNREVSLMKYNKRFKELSPKIIKRYNAGKSINQINKELDINREMISRILKDNNITIENRIPKKEKSSKWKGGKIISNNYIYIYSPSHPYAKEKGGSLYVAEHRLVMEKKLGRYLKSNEIVHHIDGDSKNNNINNLVLTNVHKHIAEHNSKRVWKEESRQKHSIKAKHLNRDNKGRFLST